MRCRIVPATLAIVLAAGAAVAVVAVAVQAQESKDPQKAAEDMAAMMESSKKYTQPGERHKALEQCVGKWTIESRFFLGGKATPPEKGTAEFSWLMPGRWLKSEWKSAMMGRPFEGFMLIGYDNFKQSYVTTTITSLDTAMVHAEGDMDQSGSALITYGTLDEYLTGENDKMAKYVLRFPSKNKMVFEVHDLGIGETNTKVLEVNYTRVP